MNSFIRRFAEELFFGTTGRAIATILVGGMIVVGIVYGAILAFGMYVLGLSFMAAFSLLADVALGFWALVCIIMFVGAVRDSYHSVKETDDDESD